MPRTVAIMQPTYLPYLGYLDLMQRADVFVFLDDCQFDRKSWQQRNRILGPGGEQMLTVTVEKQPVETEIRHVRINDAVPWRRDHLAALKKGYAKRPFYGEALDFLQQTLAPTDSNLLVDLTTGHLAEAARRLGFRAELVRASSLNCGGKRSDHSLEILSTLKAERYLSPMGSRGYIEADGVLAAAGVPIVYRSYAPVAYDQGTAQFTPYMSFLDALANLGWDGLRAYLAVIAEQSFTP